VRREAEARRTIFGDVVVDQDSPPRYPAEVLPARPYGRPDSVRPRLPAWRRGNRVEAGRRHLQVRSVRGLDQGSQAASIAAQRERTAKWSG
jgi:hypothetical protein